MAAFEKTALTRSPESTVGREISAMQAGGANDRLAALADYSKMLPNIYDSAGKQRLDIGATLGGIASLINALKPKDEKVTGMVGPTAGGTYSKDDDVASSGDGTPTIGNWDHRYTFAPTTKGVGGEAAGVGYLPPYSGEDSLDAWRYPLQPNYSSPQFMAGPSYISVPDQYQTPWSF
jgi:hypothetical protein